MYGLRTDGIVQYEGEVRGRGLVRSINILVDYLQLDILLIIGLGSLPLQKVYSLV